MPGPRPPQASDPEQSRPTNVCYLSIDGMTDPLGRSQVLPYLAGLAARGHRFHLLSMEKPERFRRDRVAVQAICDRAGIVWVPLTYLRRPPVLAGWWNSLRLGRRASRLHSQSRFDIVHARSDLASLAGHSLWRKWGVRFLYDMRALWPDERVDGGSWPQSNPLFRTIYRKFKRHQAEFIRESDAIVCLTNDARALIEKWPGRRADAPIAVIRCATDLNHFRLPTRKQRASARRKLGIEQEQKVLTYLGSVGSWYMLDEMLDFFAVFRTRHGSSRFLIVTPDATGPILAKASELGIGDAILARSATREEVPEMLAASDVGIFFIRPVPSKRASCPTKLGEMLASGLPIVSNAGVGDVAGILQETGGGVAVQRFDAAAYEEALAALDRLQFDPVAVRNKAKAMFDLNKGVSAYDALYRQLVAKGPKP